MGLYACRSCGSVRGNDTECYVCGGERFDSLDVGGGSYVCDVCGEEYDSLAALRSHERVHGGDDEDDD